jgi:hypothetical protein
MKRRLFNLFTVLSHIYLKLIAPTGRLEIINRDGIRQNTMLGYWHGDSYCMQLLLKHIYGTCQGINVIVTADKRGDVIEKIISHYGAKAIRLPDGLSIRHYLRELKEICKASDRILAASLDGPLGPLHEPKKLLFLLAAEADKKVVYIHFKYKKVIRLKHRWDKYVIPLPFSKITAYVEELGYVSKEDLRNFADYKKRLMFSE